MLNNFMIIFIIFMISSCNYLPSSNISSSSSRTDYFNARPGPTCASLQGRTLDIVQRNRTSMLAIPPCHGPTSSLINGSEGLFVFESSDRPGGESLQSGGKQINIAGELWLPRGKGPFPAVIYMPSIRGYDQEIRKRRHLYLKRGWAYFAVDPFSGRHSKPSGICQTAVVDAYRALEMLNSHPEIDGSRIAVSGYSCGGMTAQLTSYESVRQALLDRPLSFRAHVAKGPFCNVYRDAGSRVQYGPGALLVAMGEYDYLSTPEHCGRLVNDFRDAGGSAELVILAGASHDLSGTKPLRYDRQQINWHDCEISIGADGSMHDQHGVPFHRTHCFRYGGYVGSQQAQWSAIDAAEFDFLSRHLQK